jgi:O-antigen/teichoic acid export membrane protein
MASDTTKDTDIRHRVLFGTLSNLAGQFIAFGTLFLLTPFILRQLGATAYGLWVLIGSLVAYGSLLDLGLWGALIKYVAEFRARGEAGQARAVVGTAFTLYTLLGLVIAAATALASPLLPRVFQLPPEQHAVAARLTLLMGLGVGLSLPGLMPMAILRGLQRYDLVNLIDVVTTLLTAVGTVAMLLLGGGVLGLVVVNIAGILATLVLGALLIRRIAPELTPHWRGARRTMVRIVLSYSWPLFIRDAASRLQTKTDEITIGAFLPVSAIAPYSLARRLSETTHVLTRQFMKVLLPLASELHAGNDLARLRAVYKTGTRLTLGLALALGGTLMVMAQPLLVLWVGPAYASASSIVVILSLASILATCQWPAGAILQGMAQHRLPGFVALGAGLANLALSLALVRPLGLVGVALGTLIPIGLEFLIILPYLMRTIHVGAGEVVKEVFLPALVPVLLMVLVLNALRRILEPTSPAALLAIVSSGLLVYAAGYWFVGASRVERQTYRGLAANAFRVARMRLRRLV